MRKRDEIADPKSCLNKARDDERLFVLLERDPAFEETVAFWAAKRVSLGLNMPDDPKILEARALVVIVATDRRPATAEQIG